MAWTKTNKGTPIKSTGPTRRSGHVCDDHGRSIERNGQLFTYCSKCKKLVAVDDMD